MKPSVARRCKDQVREDGGREGGEMCVFGACALLFFFFFYFGGKERKGTLVKQAEWWE